MPVARKCQSPSSSSSSPPLSIKRRRRSPRLLLLGPEPTSPSTPPINSNLSLRITRGCSKPRFVNTKSNINACVGVASLVCGLEAKPCHYKLRVRVRVSHEFVRKSNESSIITRSASKRMNAINSTSPSFVPANTTLQKLELNTCESCQATGDKVGPVALHLCTTPDGVERKTRDVNRKLVGVQRNHNQGTNNGWTKHQELALKTAYFTAKPSPLFWKKVAKLVPGKSAQECFDKVHSDNLTPLPTRPSSRTKKWDSVSDLSFSGSELIKSAETKRKKTGRGRGKSHVTRKTVRHLLQKYCHVNQDNEADLFAVLEPMVNPSTEASQFNTVQSTPKHQLGSPGSSTRFHDRSSSNHKERCSRFSGNNSPLTSPPVLKKVKNLALHEKYIDQLHLREAKRKMASKRSLKSVLHQKDGEEDPAVVKDPIRAAKDALASDARDVIHKFQHSQANVTDSFSDSLEFSDDDTGEEIAS